MASLNLSINGPSIKSSYRGVVDGPALPASPPTFAQWALFSVQAPLMNAFQDGGAKESVLKVESTGDGELADLVEDFNEGRIQFAFVKVKDPNSGLPKNVLIAWCGGGVPERTKGYFTSHVAAVAKILHGYHVQITARSDSDLSPEDILQKVSDASGAKYTAGGSSPFLAASLPPVSKKPVFSPTTSGSGSSFNPLIASRGQRQENVDQDGWGDDAPQVTRSELEKVESAYKPTKVDMASLRMNRDDSRFDKSPRQDDQSVNIVKGAYQPVGKIDIASLRSQAKSAQDDRPNIVKGAYEPVGKVDIAAIRARAQRPAESEEETATLKNLTERNAGLSQAERLTELPRPKVAKKFGGSSFSGTKAPTPIGLGLGGPSVPVAPPIGAASRTFADEGGKTPAQIWAEKKAKQATTVIKPGPAVSPSIASPIAAQKSGSEWKSGYAGKSWATVQTANFARGGVETYETGGAEHSDPGAPASPGAGISALRDKFKDTVPIGSVVRSAPSVTTSPENEPTWPPPPMGSRPSGGFAPPGLPHRAAVNQEEEVEAEQTEALSAPSGAYEERGSSPVRIAIPVSRSAAVDLEPPAERLPPRPVPVPQDLPRENEIPAKEETHNSRAAAEAVANESASHHTDSHAPSGGGKRALIQYDYEKAEDNEIELREGEYVENIEMVDEEWWMGTNSQGESGLFPSNYVELIADDDDDAGADQTATPAVTHQVSAPAPVTTPAAPTAAVQPEPINDTAGASTATAQFDYEAAEDNGM
ncbi:hypothetical protein B0T26DRAFT_515412 [Lasiosphaeria miniovina]|uniref:Drebrin-like protein n=1 Tax=Lasiosphaeria miniovina TaxID=1954250 RepID=A0AA40DHY4_9PEZI|nr:uncharacterized protein B0T26DRAFT_515412 [Lasiosphaeria miniovina]KAK0703835.1 hypothetical protein B0T26DRAFT_515412 [Lasiosphaeria miniovina]